jgi:hypothetical protein
LGGELVPRSIAAFIDSLKSWVAAYWPNLGNGRTRLDGAGLLEEPSVPVDGNGSVVDGSIYPDEPKPSLPASVVDVPPHPGWLPTEGGGWADPNCKFIHLEDLLDQIPICQKLLKALRRQDPSAYEYHRRLGARLLSNTSGFLRENKLSDEARELLPTSGLMYMHEHLSDDEGEDNVPAMIYFDKQAVNIWSYHGTAYKVALAYWLRFRRNSNVELKKPVAIGGRYTVIVDNQGKVLAVPEPTTITQKIHHHDVVARKTGSRVSHLPALTMAIPSFLQTIYKDVKAQRWGTLEEWAGWLAAMAINGTTAGVNARQFMVLAERHGVAARFDVGLENPKTFFKDRACALAVDGKRKRIIHWVESFDRHLPDGRVVRVKGHFRGLTTFAWHGSEVTILMPQNQLDPRTFNVPIHEYDELDEIPSGMAPASAAAALMRKKMLEYGNKRHAS